MKIALIGNPNVGKTTLFNLLTGSHQRVGNWSGVTVDSVSGKLRRNKKIEIVDLPGIYSLNQQSPDAKVARDFLNSDKFDLIVNIVDGMNLKRNLDLTLEIIALKKPMVIAVNFSDECKKNGVIIDYFTLSNTLQTTIVPISAKKNIGIKKLISSFENPMVVKKSLIDKEKLYSCISKSNKNKGQVLTEKIDKIILNKIFSYIIFATIVFMVYYISLKVGGFFGKKISRFFSSISVDIKNKMLEKGSSQLIISLITVALVGGVGQVIGFLPQLLILFFLLAILEESGYMPRVAFIFDRLFSSIGINGKAIFPFVLSMGCSVSGVLATRTMENIEEREKTIMIIPFLPCGAKLVVFAWGADAFFNGSPFVATSLFFLAIIISMIMSKIMLKEKGDNLFVLELPNYRVPSIKNIFFVVIEKIKDFLFRAGSIIFTISIVYWFLTNFGINGYNNGDINNSFLFFFGNKIKYVFYPLGFNDWRICTSLISGIFARESIIESIAICSTDISTLFKNNIFAYSFLAFVMLSPPCLTTISICYGELKSKRKTLKMIALQFFVAYLVSFSFNVVYVITKSHIHLILFFLVGIMITSLIFLVKKGGR